MAEADSAVSLMRPPPHQLANPRTLRAEMSVSRDPLQVQSFTSEGAKAGAPGADRQPALSHAMGHFNFPVRI